MQTAEEVLSNVGTAYLTSHRQDDGPWMMDLIILAILMVFTR